MFELTVDIRARIQRPPLPRLELKLVTTELMLPTVRAWLLVHPEGFFERHARRRVNNLYFDTPDLERFAENLGGTSERRKLRLRWYGRKTTDVKASIEVKCKRNRLGWKVTQPLPGRLDLEGTPWTDLLPAIRAGLEDQGPLRLAFDFAGDPVLVNGYDREYYASADGALRATLDYRQVTYDQRGTARPNLHSRQVLPDTMVVEFKAPLDKSERLAEAIGSVPLRVTRNSKYAVGIAAMMDD